MKKSFLTALAFAATLAFSSCSTETQATEDGTNGQSTATTGAPRQPGIIKIEKLNVMMMESDPVQVHILASGHRTDDCIHVQSTNQVVEGNVITIGLQTFSSEEAHCNAVKDDFAHTIPIDMRGLKKGTYKVRVQEQEAEFTLAKDNTQQ